MEPEPTEPKRKGAKLSMPMPNREIVRVTVTLTGPDAKDFESQKKKEFVRKDADLASRLILESLDRRKRGGLKTTRA